MSRNSPDLPGLPALPAEVVSASAGRNLPSTRAGGQDDVSLNKLPQIIYGQCYINNNDNDNNLNYLKYIK